jgi:hypothetical protein
VEEAAMAGDGFSKRQFFIAAWAAIFGLSAIIALAALLTLVPWGGADEAVRDALPPPQGQSAGS